MIKAPKQWMRYAALALIIAAGFIAYGNTLKNDFVWDDELLVKDNIYIRDWSRLSGIFRGDFGSGYSTKGCLYRPLQMVTYSADYSLWGLNPAGYHLTNLLLHILAALALFWCVRVIFDDLLLSFLTSIFFVAHPVHTEAVAYISGRADSLAAIFMLLCMVFYCRRSYFPVVLSYILALFSKEYALIMPALLAVYSFAFKKKIAVKEFLTILGVALMYALLRTVYIPSHAASTSTFFQRIPGFFVAITEYLKVLLVPFNLHMEYGNKLFTFHDARAVSGLAVSLLLAAYALLKRERHPLLFFSVLWFFVALLPVSNLYPINAFMAEHWLYLPSIGFFLLLARFFSYFLRQERRKRIFAVVSMCILCWYAYLTIEQNKHWKNNAAFGMWTARHVSDSSRLYTLICQTCIKIGNAEKAEPLCRKAIALDPENGSAYTLLGVIYGIKGSHAQSMDYFEQAIRLNPAYPAPYINLGVAYAKMGNFAEARKVWEKGLKMNPSSVEIRKNLQRLDR
jgi:protein O-mannosyl-transferase